MHVKCICRLCSFARKRQSPNSIKPPVIRTTVASPFRPRVIPHHFSNFLPGGGGGGGLSSITCVRRRLEDCARTHTAAAAALRLHHRITLSLIGPARETCNLGKIVKMCKMGVIPSILFHNSAVSDRLITDAARKLTDRLGIRDPTF